MEEEEGEGVEILNLGTSFLFPDLGEVQLVEVGSDKQWPLSLPSSIWAECHHKLKKEAPSGANPSMQSQSMQAKGKPKSQRVCKFLMISKCKRPDCPFLHQSPAHPKQEQ